LSFNIDNGELRAIIGPNGAGKTTFMDIITGKTRPDSGDVIWGEKNISLIRKSESEIANLGVGRKFQKPTIFEDQSVMENLIMALKNKRSPLSVLFYKYNKIDHNKVVNIASDIGLISVLDKLSGELSHGQKQWLEIGMLLAQEPQLLLIDEPAAGMTLEERKHTVLLLKRLSKTRAVVVVEHDMEFIRNLSCKVTVLHEGAVLAEGTLDHVVKNKTVIDVYLGR
jgi:urea transport system ATP-binding protein